MHRAIRPLLHLSILAIALGVFAASQAQNMERRWLAGDSHIHSHWSPGYDQATTPPKPILGGDAIYPTPVNARKAQEFGLSWMVTTDHGGPNHSKLNLTDAYPELERSRREVPGVLQFYGMELNMPGMDHHTVIIPNSEEEWRSLFNIESQFDSNEAWPAAPERNTEVAAFRALTYMNGLPRLPVLFANHPSRSATAIGTYGLTSPRELRNNNDLAPRVYLGMEGAPGHQAGALASDGTRKRDASGAPTGSRGAYANPGAGTLGGFDQMTAIVGGVWDSMLAEGRRFWIVATSDSHVNYAEPGKPGSDFWPGQYQKTYVQARPAYDDVIDALRSGRIFAVSGDLISELDVAAAQGPRTAGVGATLEADQGSDVTITIRFRDPETRNAHGDNPRVERVDLIVGSLEGPAADREADRTASTKVLGRFGRDAWQRTGDVAVITTKLPVGDRGMYVRVRGTSTADLEPAMDPPGEDPWSDLWFYSNPVFVEVARTAK